MTVQHALIVGSFVTASVMGGVTHAQSVGAASRSAYVLTRPEPGHAPAAGWRPTTRVPLRPGDSARVVLRPVIDPSLTVGRDLSRQPVRPWLAELRLANTTTIYVDPFENYREFTWRGIDRHHTILKTQRLALSRLALPARVVRNPLATVVENQARPVVTPRAIFRIRKPAALPQPKVVMAD